MTAQRQRMVLALALVLTLVLVWFAPEDTTPAVAPAGSRSAKPRSTPAPSQARVAASAAQRAPLALREREPAADIDNLFLASTWYLPPPPAPPASKAPPPPPPAPVTPPLPFAYMGQLVEDGKAVYILSRADRVVTVQVGDAIDKNYRLDSAALGALTFVYVPLGTKQTLATGVTP